MNPDLGTEWSHLVLEQHSLHTGVGTHTQQKDKLQTGIREPGSSSTAAMQKASPARGTALAAAHLGLTSWELVMGKADPMPRGYASKNCQG